MQIINESLTQEFDKQVHCGKQVNQFFVTNKLKMPKQTKIKFHVMFFNMDANNMLKFQCLLIALRVLIGPCSKFY